MNTLILWSNAALGVEDQRLLTFAQWMGVPTKTLSLGDSPGAWRNLLPLDTAECGVAMSADTLAKLQSAAADSAGLLAVMENCCQNLLVFGCNNASQSEIVLPWLTRGSVRGAATCDLTVDDRPTTFHFPREHRDVSKQFAGLSFTGDPSGQLWTFEVDGRAEDAQAIMLANDRPVFLRIGKPSCQVFLLAGAEIPDISQPLSRSKGIDNYYDRIIPLLILLRHWFGDRIWHGPESTARLIIDDPLLAERYGFLDLAALLTSMQHEGYGTSVAFIPWNYRRTSRKIAAKLLGQEAYLSVCIHGCDHTNKEFDPIEEEPLRRKARLAIHRMESHKHRTRLPFERVMVFPQGHFSTASLMALRRSDYLAAVNTTCFPTDSELGPLTIADFLRPAVTRFHGFPVFPRHYPGRLIDFAFDLHTGRPALLVEHHQYFRDGCKNLEEFVRALRTLEPGLTWPTLTSQLARSYMMRSISTDQKQVRFFTRRFELRNRRTSSCRFLLEKEEPEQSIICKIVVDGRSVPFRFNRNLIQLEVELGPNECANIEILDYPAPPIPITRSGVNYSAKVLLRRCLSEFRDNTLARHPALLTVAANVVKRLNVTGHRTSENQLESGASLERRTQQ